MLATLADAPLNHAGFVYEPKYDGIRAIVEVAAGGKSVHLWSRLGNEKTSQFPEVAAAFADWGATRSEATIFDGEVVALDAAGRPAGFQQLQGRIHVLDMVKGRRIKPTDGKPASSRGAGAKSGDAPAAAFIAFDLLKLGKLDLRSLPLVERRKALETLLDGSTTATLRLSEQVRGDGRAMQARAVSEGWEGLIAKRADSIYRSGKRSPDWCKLKIVHEQEFVIGGWTDPRHSRSHFGALLLGVYGDAESGTRGKPPLVYVGHAGTGFDQKELERVMSLLKPLAIDRCPFTPPPATNERPHWVKPKLVCQVRFTEWTSDGILRHPVYLGLRDDKLATAVRREATAPSQRPVGRTPRPSAGARTKPAARSSSDVDLDMIIDQLNTLEKSRKDGLLDLPGDEQLEVTNLHKVFWPKLKLTKGDLLRYYVRVSPFLLPVIADRPLVMKRFPNGIAEKPFYQHGVGKTPASVRVEAVDSEDGRKHIVGGSLLTLLYTSQLASISQDPWFSRIDSLDEADFVAIDLDPPDNAPFEKVCQVALWVRDELVRLEIPHAVKTSGSHGLHVYIPLPAGAPYDAGQLLAQIVATMVAERHPREATIERAVRTRGSRVYVDFMQNMRGKTLASAYSVRANDFAGVSTPLAWTEIEKGIRRDDFTLRTVPDRLATVGDLWAPLRTSNGVDLDAVSRAVRGGGRTKRR